MPKEERKGENQKLKLLYLMKIFSKETDEEHFLTMPQIIDHLSACGVNANRKTLYMDFEELRHFGMDIIAHRDGRDYCYHVGNRDFELPELKLLVDSVQSAKFITDRKSSELIKKLESYVSKYEAKKLHRQVTITGRIKAMNESIYYNVDKLHEAISSDAQIRFKYFQWTVEKKMQLRKEGAWYQVSPWGLMWDDENYYLVGYDAEEEKIKHYRVDKMIKITVTGDRRKGKEQFEAFDMPRYARSLFGMFGGEETRVTIEGENSKAGVMFFNIRIETGKRDMLRAVLEGICYHLRWLLECVDKRVKTSDTIRFVSGGALSGVTSQMLADITGRQIETAENSQQVGAIGTALVVAAGLRGTDMLELARQLVKVSHTYIPDSQTRAIYDRNYSVFKKLYKSNAWNFRKLNS